MGWDLWVRRAVFVRRRHGGDSSQAHKLEIGALAACGITGPVVTVMAMRGSKEGSDKRRLRREMRGVLRQMTSPAPDVAGPLGEWLEDNRGIRVAAMFAPLTGEPDLMEIPARFPAIRWCFPRVLDDQSMVFQMVDDVRAGLAGGAFGVLEPRSGAPLATPGSIDAWICPGLAFDRAGGRLGRGLGYYDRALAASRPDAMKVGVCFTSQIVPTTFPEAHDVRMDLLISEHGPLNVSVAPA